jgi:CHAT domain-containing protein
MIRRLFIGLVFGATLAASSAAVAFEGAAINDRHAGLKDSLQSGNPDQAELRDAILPGLRQLLAAAERRNGKYGSEAAILLIDIGEAMLREAAFYQDKQRRELVSRGTQSLRTGLSQLLNWAKNDPRLIAQIGRGYLVLGQEQSSRSDNRQALQDLEEGLRFLEEVDAPARLRLAVYPLLHKAAPTAAARKAIGQREINLASTLTGPDAARLLQEARNRAEQQVETPLTVTGLNEARTAIEALAQKGDIDAAHAGLEKLHARIKTVQERTLFIARMKPAMFLMFPDPNAAPMVGWNAYQDRPLTAYDRVAARFFVERDLKPYIAGFDQGSLFAYQDQLNIQLIFGRIIATNYLRIPDDELRSLCRLFPSKPDGYEVDLPGKSIPSACIGPLRWGGQLASMRVNGDAIALFDIGLALLPRDRPLSGAEQAFRADVFQERLQLEADFGSPDTFLSLYEQFSATGTRLSLNMQLYKAIIEDDRQAFRAVTISLKTLPQNEERRLLELLLPQKLPVAGINVASEICTSRPGAIKITDQAAFCLSIGQAGSINFETVRNELDNLKIDDTPKGVGGLLAPDWRLWMLLRRAEFDPVRPHFWRAFAVRGFTQRPLSIRERTFLNSPVAADEFEKAHDRSSFLFADDFDAALIADELARRGQIELALGWAYLSGIRYRTGDSPGTLLLSHLAVDFHEESYRDGWRWLITGHPALALDGFRRMVPENGTQYTRDARSGQEDRERDELDWERMIGAAHGAMIASRELRDEAGARAFAVKLVRYVRSALAMQSFSRNETQEIILRTARPALEYAANILADNASMDGDEADAVFQIAQLVNTGGAGGTVNRLGARLAAVSPVLADIARQREEMRRQWIGLDLSATEQKQKIGAQIDELDRRLKTEFPRYVELASVSSVPMDRIAKTLAADEALVSYLKTEDGYIATVITASDAKSVKLKSSVEVIDRLVQSTRRGILIRGGRLPNFRYDDAHALYNAILKPVETAIGKLPGKLLIVPDGALEIIPFSILVTSPDGREYGNGRVEWLADRHVITRLPSATSLPILREAASTNPGKEPFLGIGDPALEGNPADLRGYELGEILSLRGGAEIERLRALPRLPDTANELQQLSITLGASAGSLVLGQQATESRVRSMNLDRYAILAFATHGLVAGEIGSLREPGLVLTPSEDDEKAGYDGYLAASEIAEMRLNAEMVLLSACNTAAPGAKSADGLSGLAKSFFFAGTRNLLVSHWAVDSVAASRLTTSMLRAYRQDSELSYSAALGMAMKEMRQSASQELSHPALWAPFEIVGAD